MRAAIFDLDGTLADTSADLIAAANAALVGMGVNAALDAERDAATAFAGGRAMLRLGLDKAGGDWTEADVDAGYQPLLDHYGAYIDVYTKLYPGVEAALDRLANAGWALGVCTNKPEGLAETLLTKLGIRDRFGAMFGADTLPVRKPNPEHLWATIDALGADRARSVLIGDTITDRKAAENANVPCVLVRFGPDGDGVKALNPEAFLAHYDEIEDVLNSIVP